MRCTMAAVALFGPELPGDYPQFRLHLAHFNGVKKDADMLDMRPPIYGHLFKPLAEAEALLRRTLPQAGRLVPGLIEREDEPVSPVKALREVLANALAHWDYSLPGGAIHVAIYTDHVEATNTGELLRAFKSRACFRCTTLGRGIRRLLLEEAHRPMGTEHTVDRAQQPGGGALGARVL